MSTRTPGRQRLRRTATALLPVVAMVLAAAGAAPAGAAGAVTADTTEPTVPGWPPVAPPDVTAPGPLPTRSGSVPVSTSLTTASGSVRGTGAGARTTQLAALAAPQLNKAGLRALIVALDTADPGVPTWKTVLDEVGAAYDVLYTRTAPLTADTLVRADGAGRYNAILLTDSGLLYPDGTGNFLSGLTDAEWNTLWAYERDYAVRQATLWASYGTFPESYCLVAGSEGGVGDTPLYATLTTAGATPFSYLKSGVRVPIVASYVYRTRVAAGCNGTAVLTAGSDVLGVRSTSTDGRERMALTFSTNVNLLQAKLLPYGLFRWASRGLFLGEQRHYLNIDVDDWFNESDLWINGAVSTTQFYQGTGHDAYNAYLRQNALRAKYPLASGLTFGMAYNGEGANLTANATCSPNGGVGTLTATSRCLRNTFRWVNHTLTHPKLNFTDYATTLTEINQNLVVAATLGLPVDRRVLKTGEYSGLGVYNPSGSDIDPPTDFGILASNPDLLRAAKDAGVKYLHGNMSFASHRPPCFNCGLVHPMEPALTVVPDWPTNIAYFSNTPASQTSFYNAFYGPNGRFPSWPTNLTYNQILEVETEQALRNVAAGSIYSTTFHIPNLDDYGSGRTLLTDWADVLIGKYNSYYAVPLLSPGWPALATYTTNRNAHFAQRAAGVDAVYDRTANRVTVTSPAAGTVQVTGARTAGFTTYGSESSALLTLAADTAVVFTPSLLP